MPILKNLKKRKLLLDTHVWIWVLTENKRIGSSFLKVLKEIEERVSEEKRILISAISVWEIGMLVEKKKIELSMDRLNWVEKALTVPGTELVSLSPRIAMQSTRLPNAVHGDPADRILIATAREKSAVLVTHDRKILDYGRGRFIHVFDPC